MDDAAPEPHPELLDPAWSRRAERRARRHVRRVRRRAFWRRNHRRLAVWVVVVAIVGAAAVLLRDGPLSRWPSGGGAAPLQRHDAASSAITPTPTSRNLAARVNLNQPFITTPAAGWADGAAGIVPTQATPVGSYRAEEVAATMDKVRQVVIAARLDRRVLEGHDPEPYLSLLAPEEAERIRPYFVPGREKDSSWFASKVADGYPLLPAEPKVNGSMSAAIGDDGHLLVHTNYVFAYAFRPSHPETLTDAMDIVLVDRWEFDYEVISGSGWPTNKLGVWPKNGDGHEHSVGCALSKQGFLAPAFSDRRLPASAPSQGPDSYFDPNRPLPTDDTCPK
jgi:hypothetical protein